MTRTILLLIATALAAGAATAAFLVRPSGGSAGAALPGAGAARRCGGVERWAVKTLTDPDAASVNLTPRHRSIDWLRARSKPTLTATRIHTKPPVEFQAFRIYRAYLVAAAREADHDIHLVVADVQGRTLIVEFPDTACVPAASSAFAAEMAAARADYVSACGGLPPKGSFVQLHGRATITGVGFFDKKHATEPNGAAPNEIELHPALSLVSNDCARSG